MNSLYYYIFFSKKVSGVLPVFTCARAIGNFWSICLGVSILRCEPRSDRNLFSCFGFIENIPILKALQVNSRPL